MRCPVRGHEGDKKNGSATNFGSFLDFFLGRPLVSEYEQTGMHTLC